jgi:hypothetical protein
LCPGEETDLSRAGASGSHHLPWALSRILQSGTPIKGPVVESTRTGQERGVACSKDVSSASRHGRHDSATAASDAANKRGSGPDGKRSNDTGRPNQASRTGTAKAGATGSESATVNHPHQNQLASWRGSSLTKIFFDHCCDRPGCYERFGRQRRSPLQRYCSRDCRQALERVHRRERRFKTSTDLSQPY